MRVNIPLTFLLGTAAGYVAGSAAGRRRYEQIRTAAGNFVHDPAVRDTASKVATSAASAGTATATKAKDVASTVKDAVQKNGDNGSNDIQLDPSLRIDADAPTIS